MFKKLSVFVILFASLTLTTIGVAHAQTESRAVYAELLDPIDARTAKVGDHISAKLEDAVRFKSGDRLPAGALLTGSIISVDPSGVTLSILFSRVQFDGHEPSPISVVIWRLDDASISADDTLEDVDVKDIKATGEPVSKLCGVVLTNITDGSASAIFSSKVSHCIWSIVRSSAAL